MNIDRQAQLSRIVLDHPECAAVLAERRLDFCCAGAATLPEACASRGLDPEQVFAELEAAVASRTGTPAEDPRAMDTGELITHIVSRHHAYLRSALPFLFQLTTKVARVHGDHDPRLRELKDVFVGLGETLDAHLDREEETLFRQATAPSPDRALVARELSGMAAEHRLVGAALQRLRELADDFAPPEWACTSYRTLLKELRALEADVLQHVHLENHLLLPRLAAA